MNWGVYVEHTSALRKAKSQKNWQAVTPHLQHLMFDLITCMPFFASAFEILLSTHEPWYLYLERKHTRHLRHWRSFATFLLSTYKVLLTSKYTKCWGDPVQGGECKVLLTETKCWGDPVIQNSNWSLYVRVELWAVLWVPHGALPSESIVRIVWHLKQELHNFILGKWRRKNIKKSWDVKNLRSTSDDACYVTRVTLVKVLYIIKKAAVVVRPALNEPKM